MATTTQITERSARPRAATMTAGLLTFLGVTAAGGGAAMTFGVGGDEVLPSAWLESIPLVESWVVPGLVLGLGFGVGSLVVAYGVARRPRWRWLGWLERATGHHWSWAATIAVGMAHVAWIALELVWLPEASWLQAVYGPLGVALAVLPFTAAMRTWLSHQAG